MRNKISDDLVCSADIASVWSAASFNAMSVDDIDESLRTGLECSCAGVDVLNVNFFRVGVVSTSTGLKLNSLAPTLEILSLAPLFERFLFSKIFKKLYKENIQEQYIKEEELKQHILNARICQGT